MRSLFLAVLLLGACNPEKPGTTTPTTTTPSTTTVPDPVPPTIAVDSPTMNQTFLEGEVIPVQVTAADPDETDLQNLTLSWTGVAAGAGAPDHPDSFGNAEFFLTGLPIGQQTFQVTVTDADGLTQQASALFEIVADEPPDNDGDGYDETVDCDDTNSAINPGATEVCDALDVDEDCSGQADDDDVNATGQSTWYADTDGDGFGDPGSSVDACDQPTGYVLDATDCDDGAIDVNPGEAEVCDALDVDEDCSGQADDDDVNATGQTAWYADGDSDSYGDPTSSQLACDAPANHVADNTDCDDGDPTTNPGAAEQCDADDHDCSGAPDNNVTDVPWYADTDTDGYGDPASTVMDCSQPAGYVADATDCDDGDIAVHPGATEVCNGYDDNCVGGADEGVSTTFYADTDTDGYGDPLDTIEACTAPPGYVADATDCDDSDIGVHPGAAEICDPLDVDEDCDNLADDADSSVTGQTTWYADTDMDGFGDLLVTTDACDQPSGYVANSDDCNDADPTFHPGATEICDTFDNDCNTIPDDGPGCGVGCPVYADPTVPPGGDGSFGNPFPNIGYAIAFRPVGCDEILLNPGTYNENVDYGGEDLQIRSVAGPASTIVTSAVGGSIFSFTSGETPAALLTGVTITGGDIANGGGVYINASDPTIEGCVFDGNTATSDGGGLRLESSSAVIAGNTFTGNYAGDEGGAISVVGGSPLIDGNRIESNTTNSDTGGIHLDDSAAVVVNNVLLSNDGVGIYLYDATSGLVANNTVAYAGYAALQTYNLPTTAVQNNIFYASGTYDVRFYSSSSLGALTFQNNDAYGSPFGMYNASPDPIGTDGNISTNPQFVGGGDYSLAWGSRAIDGGRDPGILGVPHDYDGTDRPLGVTWDIGAFESYGSDPDCTSGGPMCAASCPVYVDASALPGGNGDSADPFPSIGYAMTYANGCTDIRVRPGTYDENVDFGSTDWQIASTDGPAGTTITSSVGESVVRITGGQTPAASLTGLTITGGDETDGGGLFISASDPTISDCVFDSNRATYDGGGLRIESSDALIAGNSFVANHAGDEGGAISVVGGAPTIDGNWIDSNTTNSDTGGIHLDDTDAVVVNNVIVDNEGVGVYLYDATAGLVGNNTIVRSGYAALQTYNLPTTRVVNNIFYMSDTYDVRFYSSSSLGALTFQNNDAYGAPFGLYNASPDPIGNDGNMSTDPQFVGGSDYSLSWGSRCIDGGTDPGPLGLPTDYDGLARPRGAAWDIGAFEPFGEDPVCPNGGTYCATTCPVYVDAAAVPGGDGSSGSPYPSIGYAMTYANGCTDILLRPGSYDENVDFGTTDWSLSSTDGAATTVLRSSIGESVVRITGGQSSAAQLVGLTISGGSETDGGGVFINGSDPTIADCVFDGNTARYDGGGLRLESSDALIQANAFTANHAGDEGGAISVVGGAPILDGNWLENNTTNSDTGGIHLDDTAAVVANNVLRSNDGVGIYLYDATSGLVANNTIAYAGYAALQTYNLPTTAVVNNIFYASGTYDVRFYSSSSLGALTFQNNDVYGAPFGLYNASPDPIGNDGNFSADPQFVGGSDYSLAWGSRCIDGGRDPGGLALPWDFDGNARPLGAGWDVGAYEPWGAPTGCPAGGASCATACPVYVDPTALPGGDGSMGNPFPTIGYAMTFANGCTEIRLEPGTYDENVDFGSTDWKISSTGGSAVTTLTSSIGESVVRIAGGQSATATLEGVRVEGGSETTGAGLFVNASDPTVRDCIFDGNIATADGGGIRLESSSSVVVGCSFLANHAGDEGGAISVVGGAPVIDGNWLEANTTNSDTGGIHLDDTSALVSNNVVVDNEGVGIYLYDATSGAVINNTVVRSGYAGLQTYNLPTTAVLNNILVNAGTYDVRFYSSSSLGALTWENNDMYGSPFGLYNASPDPVGMNGNISIDPMFTGPLDFSLVWGSSCIDGGQDASSWGVSVDFARAARPGGLGYDMGAYESY